MASIKLKHASGNSTILNSPAANPTNDVTLKLPSTTGSAGQVLKVASANHSATNAELEFGADTGGKILQVKSAQKTDRQTSTSASFIDITGLSVDMAISNSGNKILMSYNVTTGGNWWDLGPVYVRFMQDSTAIGQLSGQSHSFANLYSDGQGNSSYNLCTQSGTFLFTPSDTNSHTYKVQSQGNNTNGYAINGWWANSSVTCVSNITLMEVAA